MSIYGTMWEMHVSEGGYCLGDRPGDENCACVDVYAQGVPAHIDYTGEMWDEWLPPPVEDRDGNLRAVFICGPETTKGTARCGQEYVNALVVLSGDEYEAITFRDLMQRIWDGLERANRPNVLRERIRELEEELANTSAPSTSSPERT